jgi:hypothetical protein
LIYGCKDIKNEKIQGNNLPKFEKIQGNNSAKIEKIQGNNFPRPVETLLIQPEHHKITLFWLNKNALHYPQIPSPRTFQFFSYFCRQLITPFNEKTPDYHSSRPPTGLLWRETGQD